MLSPFKTFLNTLQKNGVSIFGRSSPSEQSSSAPPSEAGDGSGGNDDDNNTHVPVPETLLDDSPLPLPAHAPCTAVPDESPVEFHIADDEQLSQQSCDDPLSDPLALEDRLQYDSVVLTADGAVNVDNFSGVTLVDVCSLTPAERDLMVPGARTDQIGDDAGTTVLQFEEVVADIADLTPEETCVEEAGVRSDGSDSGLGQESTNSSLAPCDITPIRTPMGPTPRQPLRTALKRRSDHITDPTDTFDDVDGTISANTTAKRPKRNIHFNDVTVYYFQRQQGFMCVPSQGGCSLGMAATHAYRRRFTLAEYAAEQRRVQRHKAQELKRSAGLPVSSSEDSAGGSDDECNGDPNYDASATSSASTSAACASDQPNSDSDDAESMGIQPVSARQRRVMLKAAGVRKIDASEKKECRDILQSRDNCGCNCRGFCDPETCACAQSGIKCQVDRLHYPCGCTRDGCGNTVGRAEFNKARVKTHYIHTFLRLQLESKPPPLQRPEVEMLQRPEVEILLSAPMQAASTSASIGNWNMQVGRSLAAMSGDNLYNMNGAATTVVPTTTAMANAHDIMPLQLDQTPDLHYAYGDDVYDTGLSTTATSMHGTSGTASQFDCFASAASASGSGSGLNTPTNICGSPAAPAFAVLSAATSSSMYSPDSASIVEPTPHEPTTSRQAHNDYNNPPKYPAATATCSSQSYPDYGNITGYQHSYLYSLQQQQAPQSLHDAPAALAPLEHTTNTGYQHSYLYSLMLNKSAPSNVESDGVDSVDTEDDRGLFGSCAMVLNDTVSGTSAHPHHEAEDAGNILDLEFEVDFSNESAAVADDGLSTLDEFFETPGATTSVAISSAASRCDFDLEPIDFESELGLATTFIDKSLKTCVTPPRAAVLATLSDTSTIIVTTPATTAATNGHDETNNI